MGQWLEALGPAGPWLGALVILVVGWLASLAIRWLVVRLLHKTRLDERMANSLGLEEANTERGIGKFVFYLLMLFVFVVALDAAKFSAEATEPLRELLTEIVAFLPNLIGAGLLTFAAFALASIVRRLLQGVLHASRIDERLGLGKEERPLSAALTTVAYFLVILLILPGILSVLGIEAVSNAVDPIVAGIIGYVPNVIGGGIVLAVGIFLAYIVQKTLVSVLQAAKFDSIPQKMGHNGELKFLGSRMSTVVSYLAMVTVLIFVAAQAIDVMNLEMLGGLAGLLVRVWGGTILFLAGLFVAGLARSAIKPHSERWAGFAHLAIAIFVGGMALQAAQLTPLSTQTVQVILYATIGALAVALGIGGAVAVGMGGRHTVETFLTRRIEPEIKEPPMPQRGTRPEAHNV